MKYVGVDLHKHVIVICVVNPARQVLERQRFHCRQTDELARWFAAQQPFAVVVEATASYEWFVQLVEPLAQRVVLAHPAKLRVIAASTRKSDQLDARVLAEFLALDLIPAAHRPTPHQRAARRLTRYRHWLQGRITSLKNRIRHILADFNADRPDLFTHAGCAAAAQLALPAADRFVLDELFALLDEHRARLAEANQQLREFARSAPPEEQGARRQLATIPGVGPVTIDVFLAETADVRRFGSQKKLTAYAGLSPGFRGSAGSKHDLGIERRGSRLLRWALVEAAWRLTWKDPHWGRVFETLARRRGKKKAIVAIARRLLGVMMAVIVNDCPYRRVA